MASSLFDALAAGSPEKKEEIGSFMSGEFAKKVDTYANMIVSSYMKNNADLNKSIASIAEKENLNDDQMSRIIEEVNNQIYLLKYNQMKGAPEREVVFDIASLPKVKDIAKNGEINKPVNQQKVASSISAAFEKTASEQEYGDSLNFLNYTADWDTSSLATDKQVDRKSYLQKIAFEELSKLDDEFKERTEKLANNIYDIAEVLIKYDRTGVDTANIFAKMCKTAGIRKTEQIMIKDAITQKVAQCKEYKVYPEEYNFNVDLVDIDKVADEFSLGKFSLMEKLATDTESNQNVPIVVTDRKTVKSVNNLIDLARDAVQQKRDVEDTQRKIDDSSKKMESVKR